MNLSIQLATCKLESETMMTIIIVIIIIIIIIIFILGIRMEVQEFTRVKQRIPVYLDGSTWSLSGEHRNMEYAGFYQLNVPHSIRWWALILHTTWPKIGAVCFIFRPKFSSNSWSHVRWFSLVPYPDFRCEKNQGELQDLIVPPMDFLAKSTGVFVAKSGEKVPPLVNDQSTLWCPACTGKVRFGDA